MALVLDLSLVFLWAILLSAAIQDGMERRISNRVIAIGVTGAVMLSSTTGVSTVLLSVSGLLITLAVFIPTYIVGWLGAGDVKLLGVVGAFLGVEQLLSAWALIALAGGGLSLVYLILSRYGLVDKRVPYAVAIFLGVSAHLVLSFQ